MAKDYSEDNARYEREVAAARQKSKDDAAAKYQAERDAYSRQQDQYAQQYTSNKDAAYRDYQTQKDTYDKTQTSYKQQQDEQRYAAQQNTAADATTYSRGQDTANRNRQAALDARKASFQDSYRAQLLGANPDTTDAGSYQPGGPPPAAAQYDLASTDAARAAAGTAQAAQFGQAKATAGSLGRASLEGLRSEMAGRGIGGSGIEARGLVDRLAAATNPLSDLNTAQLGENATTERHNVDAANAASATQYQGAIAQRGQDISVQEGNATRALQRQQENARRLADAMKGLLGSY